MKSTMMPSPLLIPLLLDRAGKYFPNVEVVSALADGTLHRSTFADLHHRSRQLTSALLHQGIRKGDRVATLLWNNHEHLEAYFGIPAAGAVLHTLSLRQHPDNLAYIIHHAGDRFLIVEDILLDVLAKVRPLTHFERIFVVNRSNAPLPAGTESYEDLLASAPASFPTPDLAEDDAAAMCYTSGTTGRPKGVVYSHRAISLHSLAICLPDQINISRHDNLLPVVPMFHVNAWGMPFAAVMNGCKQVLPGRNLQPRALLDLMQQEQVTLAAGVPTIWLGLLEALEANPNHWKLSPSLRLAIGGAAASESMLRRFDSLGIEVIHAWGMTETTPVATVSTLKRGMHSLPADQRFALRARQGLPVPFIDVRAFNDEGEVPWDGQTVGELQVRGPWVAATYHSASDQTAGQQTAAPAEDAQPDKWTSDGWFCTGDVATIDAEGYIKITDRLKDLIKSGGEWISSIDLESALAAHPAVHEAAVIAVPHPRWQERPLAIIVLKENHTADAEEFRALLLRNFATWQIPDAFVFATELPHTATGKLLKTKLRHDYHDWQWSPNPAPDSATNLP